MNSSRRFVSAGLAEHGAQIVADLLCHRLGRAGRPHQRHPAHGWLEAQATFPPPSVRLGKLSGGASWSDRQRLDLTGPSITPRKLAMASIADLDPSADHVGQRQPASRHNGR